MRSYNPMSLKDVDERAKVRACVRACSSNNYVKTHLNPDVLCIIHIQLKNGVCVCLSDYLNDNTRSQRKASTNEYYHWKSFYERVLSLR